jgi:hypothetical protein
MVWKNCWSRDILRRYATAPVALFLAFFFHPGDDWCLPQWYQGEEWSNEITQRYSDWMHE